MPSARVRTTSLPGIGLRYDLSTREGRHLSVVAHRDGSRTLSAYHHEDPDACAFSARLTPDECSTLVDAMAPVHEGAGALSALDLGLVAERISLSAGSYWNGRLLGETRMRTATGCSIVAVLRRTTAVPSPAPDLRLAGGDTLVVVGTREGVEHAASILDRE